MPGRAPLWRRRLARHRGPLAALLAAALVWSLASALRPAPPETSAVLVAARDLPPGTTLAASDLVVAQLPAGPADAPSQAEDLIGRAVVVPLRSGEPVLARHLLTSSLLAGYGDDVVATPVRLSDDSAAAVVRPGDLVDVLAASPGDAVDPGSGTASVVASRVRVLLSGDGSAGSADGGLLSAPTTSTASAVLVLATTSAQALAIARASVSSRISVVVRGG